MAHQPLLAAGAPGDSFAFEHALNQRGFTAVGGTDEVGRGPLAGPVVAACVILPPDCDYHQFVDSKSIPAGRREQLYHLLQSSQAAIGIGIVSPATIDRINILQASLLAMTRAVLHLGRQGRHPDYLLVDGTFEVPLNLPQQPLVKGESRSSSIAAASIIAKVVRDRLMVKLHKRYPLYNFQKHKGYPTAEHRRALAEHGPCAAHRRSFKGVLPP